MTRNRSTVLVTLLVALAAFVAVSGLAEAQSTLETVKKRGKLIAGVKTDFPPFGYVDAGGKNLGFDVDVAHLFAKALFNDENHVELVAVTSGNRIPFLQSGKIDIIIATVTVTDERKQVVQFSEPYFLSGSLLLVSKASAVKSLDDLLDKKIGDLTMSQFMEAKRYTAYLAEGIRTLGEPDVQNYFNRKYEARGKTVPDLIDYMNKEGLVFVNSIPGSEAPYRTLYTFLAAYEDAVASGQINR